MLTEIAAIANYPGREITITSSYFSVFKFCLLLLMMNSDSIVSVIILIFIASVNKIINMLYLIAG